MGNKGIYKVCDTVRWEPCCCCFGHYSKLIVKLDTKKRTADMHQYTCFIDGIGTPRPSIDKLYEELKKLVVKHNSSRYLMTDPLDITKLDICITKHETSTSI